MSRLFCLLCGFALLVPRAAAQSVYFDDSGGDELLLGNSHYEVAFDSATGAILRVTEASTGRNLFLGTSDASLFAYSWEWRWYTSAELVGLSGDVFSYQWNDQQRQLSLTFDSGSIQPERPVTAVATFRVTDGPVLDMEITVRNDHGELPVDGVSFPHRLKLSMDGDDEALLPVAYPGMLLEGEFFENGHDAFDIYNGLWHADWAGLTIDGSTASLYNLWGDGLMTGTIQGLLHQSDGADHNYVYAHRYQTWMWPGETWRSPTTRLRLGMGYFDSLLAYREENGIDVFPSLEDKLGSLYPTVVSAPLMLRSFGEAGNEMHYNEAAAFLEKMPHPSLIMLSWFWEGDFEGNHPDYVPPAARWGTTADFVQMIEDLHANGDVVMPFSLPIWWNENSTELLTTADLEEVAVINREGNPDRTNWGPNWGYFMSLCSGATLSRVEQIYSDLFDVYDGDLMYADVIGAQPPYYDFNEACSHPTVQHESQVELLRSHSQYPTVVEAGYDRIAEHVVGFMGSLFSEEENPVSPFGFQEGWRLYPTAPWLFHDKVISYRFWNNSKSAAAVSFSLHFGVPLTSWSEETDEYLGVYGDFQQGLLSRIVGQPMTGYEDLSGAASRSTFGDMSIVHNRSWSESFELDGYVLPPQGSLARSAAGDVVGGVLSTFEGTEMSPGDHYLVVDRADTLITIRHPLGPDTPMTLDRPGAWSENARVQAFAVTAASRTQVPRTLTEASVVIELQSELGAMGEVIRYEIAYTSVAPNAAPTLILEIADVELRDVGGPESIELNDHFSDADGDSLTFEVVVMDATRVGASVVGSALTMMPGSPGSTTVTVTASDGIASSTAAQFLASTDQNDWPSFSPPFADLTLAVADGPLMIELFGSASDPEGDTITYGAAVDDPSIVDSFFSGTTLELQARATGSTRVSVFAQDEFGAAGATEFQVTVPSGTAIGSDDSSVPTEFYMDSIYPNPARSMVTIRFGQPKPGRVLIRAYSADGRLMASLEDRHVLAGRFQRLWPVSALPSGVYLIEVRTESGRETKGVSIRH